MIGENITVEISKDTLESCNAELLFLEIKDYLEENGKRV